MVAVAGCAVALAQESATVRGPEVVKAGEVVDLEISVDTAPNFDGGGIMVWVANVQSSCDLPRGQKVCHYKFRVPVDAPSGMYYVDKLAFWTGSRQIDLPFKKMGFQVVANSGLIFPTSAEVKVRASQIQLLRGEATRLETRVQMLKASFADQQEPLGRAALRTLRNRVEEEVASLKVTESKFQQLGDESQADTAGVFFDDLRTGYTEVLSGLSGEEKRSRTGASLTAAAWVPRTQTGQDKGPAFPANQRKNPRYALTAVAAFQPFELNRLAYELVAATEALTFDLEVNSNPEGSSISYGRRGDTAYKQHQSPTNSTIKSLPYAIWTVRFQKQGFRDKDVEFNPFVERYPVIMANLEK